MGTWSRKISVAASLVLTIGLMATGDHRAGVGESAPPILNSVFSRTVEAERADYDTGCGLLYCQGSCDQWDTAWKCWIRTAYERYGYNPIKGWYDLPILVEAEADCTVYHLWQSSCEESEAEAGEGVVRAEADCWIHIIFSGTGTQDGGCSCTELW